METPPPATCRWVRFSLRTLFVLVTLLCIYLGWAMHWIRQRQQFLQRTDITVFHTQNSLIRAPLLLRPLGEEGQAELALWNGTKADDFEAQRLFPEAEVNPPLSLQVISKIEVE